MSTVIYNFMSWSNSSKLLIDSKFIWSCSKIIFLILSSDPLERAQKIMCLLLLIFKNLLINLKSISFLIEERFGILLILKLISLSKLYSCNLTIGKSLKLFSIFLLFKYNFSGERW